MSNQPNLDPDSNTGNQYGTYGSAPQYFGDFSSMSTLASAAHAQGQQHPSHEMQGPHGAPSAAAGFPDLDAHLALYGNLQTPHAGQEFGNYTATAGLAGGTIVGGYDRPGAASNDWYSQPIGPALYGFLDTYQGLPEQPPAHTGELMRNGNVQQVSAAPSAPATQIQSVEHSPPAPVRRIPEPPSNHQPPISADRTIPREPQEHRSSLPARQPSVPVSQPVQPLQAVRSVVPTKPVHVSPRTLPDKSSLKTRDDFRPKVSIPTHLSPEEYARQCIYAAYSSRLSPFALHPDEYELLRSHINHLQVTGYLNIRNGILRLWMNNPLVSVTREEAAGCAKDYRWFDVADVAYQWLVRKGYINFGCVEVPGMGESILQPSPEGQSKRTTIVIVGAGMSGLGCARQLEGLFHHFGYAWTAKGEELPKVVILEGRGRIGGRVYSHPLKEQTSDTLPPGLQCTADLGAQIITGFDNGNPLSAIIRGQLALHHHPLTDTSILYDIDGTAVDKQEDQLVEKLFNDILERVSTFRNQRPPAQVIEGDRELIELGRDPAAEGGKVISVVEDAAALIPPSGADVISARNGSATQVSATVDKLTGKAHVGLASASRLPAAESARRMGWPLKAKVGPNATLDLDSFVRTVEHPTLGSTMYDAIRQYQSLIELTPQDLRLLNWHFANLEYANAANVNDLSLGGWDQDIDNEFEGEHAGIVGGYGQVPRALWHYPTKLDVRTRKVVQTVRYRADGSGKARVDCDDGTSVDADRVIVTLPLGVLKEQSVKFDPPLPDWKTGPIERLGFGTLNKVILVFDEPFWESNRDMFGLLRDSAVEGSLNQTDYVSRRGRSYLFWNCIKTSGRPTLVALMVGDAAHQVEVSNEQDLANEVRGELSKIYGEENVPEPTEVIVSRWRRDRFARGSYSYVGPQARPDDYDAMARLVGNLHFAGEATCGTHPATVHGAYLSGLRAASEVIDAMLGPIEMPSPLLAPKSQFELPSVTTGGRKRKADESALQRYRALKEARQATYEAELLQALLRELGERPMKPEKSGANPFLLYQKDHWHICKQKCDDTRKQASKNPDAKATRNEVRAALGQMWRDASEAEKKPYLEQTASNKQSNSASASAFKEKVEQWDVAAEAFRREYYEKYPNIPSEDEQRLQTEVEQELGSSRAAKRLNGLQTDLSDSALP